MRLLYSWSTEISQEMLKLGGKLNKWFHYKDMLNFKLNGIRCYDFGGISTKDKDSMNGIDKFKYGFGGDIVDYRVNVSLLYVILKRIL